MFINRKEKVIKMKISVILTSYNHEKFLRQSIESVLDQTYQDFEFIIVDDCSTDHSWKIICEYKDRYPQIIAIRHDYNWHGGSIDDAVRNYASGDYIAVHHSDDIWMKDNHRMHNFSRHRLWSLHASQKVYQEQFMFRDVEEFCWTCRLAENEGEQIKGLRFDPAEGLMVKVKIERVTVNGADAEFQEENALCSREGWQLFLNLDPIYTIKLPVAVADGESLNVCIEGKMQRLGTAAAGQAAMEVMYEKRDMIYEYQGEAAAAKKSFNEARQQINMQEQKNAELELCLKEQERKNCELDAQLQKIKSSRWYRLAEKVHLFDR